MKCQCCKTYFNITTHKPYVHKKCGLSYCQKCCSENIKCKGKDCKIQIKDEVIINKSLMQEVEKKLNNPSQDVKVKIMLIGNSGVGKSCLMQSLKDNQYRQGAPTIGPDLYCKTKIVNQLKVIFQLWDTAGAEQFQSMLTSYYKNANIMVLVYDVNKSAQENNLFHWTNQIQQHSSKDIITILVGNKIDMKDPLNNLSPDPIDKNTKIMIQTKQLSHYKVSCKNNQGIQQLWTKLQEQTKKLAIFEKAKSNIKDQSEKLKLQKQKEKSGGWFSCCDIF